METLLIVEDTTSSYLTNPSFSGHQTFPFRYTWLKKGVDAVVNDPTIFSSENASVTLGVGKNMVSSIRHWCNTARLIKRDTLERGLFIPTKLGKTIFDDKNGFDPYLDDPATLWLIHWQIATNGKYAATWCWAFNFLNYPEFTRDSLTKNLVDWIKQWANIRKQPSETTIKQDINCFIRTYYLSRSAVSTIIEDTFDCPLVELDLIREMPDENRFQFNLGPKPSLTDSILALTINDFWNRWFSNKNTLSFSEIMYSKFSPGRVFKIDENTMVTSLEKLELITNGDLTYDETAGLKQISRHKKLDSIKLLKRVYE